MKTSTFLIAPLLISFSSASLIGRNNGAIAEVQRSGYLTEAGVQQAGGPIARKYIRRDRVRRQIPQLPKVPTEGVPGAQPQLPGVIPTVPEVASSSVQAEEPATTVLMVAPTTAPIAVVPVVPIAEPVVPVVPSAAPVVPVVPIATPVVPVVSSAAPVVPVIPSAAPVKPVIPVVPVTPGMPGGPGGPGGPGAAPIVIPPGSGDLPGRTPTGPVDEPLKVEGDLPPGFSVIGSVTAPSGVLEEPVKPSAAPSAVVPSNVATVAPVPVSSGAAGLPPAVPTSQPADGLPTSGAPELPAATTGLAKLPLTSAPANAPASSVQASPPLSTVLTGLFTSSAPAALPIPSTPSQVVPVVPGSGNPVAGRPSFGNVQPVVSSAVAEPTLPALPNGFSVISSNIPAAAAATAGMHDFNRNTAGSQASATSSSPGAGVTPTGLAGLDNGTGVAGNLPAGFKVIEAPAATTLVRRVRRRSIPQNDEELMYRYGSSK
ncbi:hypothetical protein AOL_s00080g48 [Orbilia oligospora ATCC 24927]|uniref:Uncharacterized protein n=1 Tax=Arthrobotrys oligospora (strain ATCC 24927 / CBS 115.81 / DSM 1491) TaxID=756982 RepID=G1XE13_ARTOA|nr:hypothetical protein AOL_s00080g48 [Orbilia oligospora ATCC 24927]EGX48419.1 hypothetical protein AOL_s00080g48 [Orbilia oligospora ATCC 24927]